MKQVVRVMSHFRDLDQLKLRRSQPGGRTGQFWVSGRSRVLGIVRPVPVTYLIISPGRIGSCYVLL